MIIFIKVLSLKLRFRDKQTAELERVDGKRCDYKKREGLCPGDAASYIE